MFIIEKQIQKYFSDMEMLRSKLLVCGCPMFIVCPLDGW